MVIAYDGLSVTLGMPSDQVEVIVLALMLRPHPDRTPSAVELEGVAGICAIAFGPGRTGWQSWVPRVEQAHRLLYPSATPWPVRQLIDTVRRRERGPPPVGSGSGPVTTFDVGVDPHTGEPLYRIKH